MRTQKDGLAAISKIEQQLAYDYARPRVKSRGRLIQDQQLRIIHNGLGKANTLQHPPRESFHIAFGLGAQTHFTQNFDRSLGKVLSGHPV